MSKSSGCRISCPRNISVLPDYDSCRAPLFSPQTREADIDTIASAARAVARARRLNWHATADLVQQTLVRVLIIQGTFDVDRAKKRGALLWAWSAQVAGREFGHDFRRKRPRCYSDLSRHANQIAACDVTGDYAGQDSAHRAELIEAVYTRSQKLPPALKEAFDLLVSETYDLRVSRDDLDSTIRSRKCRMLKALRHMLIDDVA
jgi:DNA-directed RNA polymerase specialized sigma24 family protein